MDNKRIPGVEYYDISWVGGDDHATKGIKFKETFAQNRGPNPIKGVMPELVRGLRLARKEDKKLMKVHKDDPIKYSMYNLRQLAKKLSGNSAYGFLAAPKLQEKRLASSVTGATFPLRAKAGVQRLSDSLWMSSLCI